MKTRINAIVLLSSTLLTNATALAVAAVAKDTFAVHVPVGKDGEGAYTAATKGCFDVINTAAPLVLNQVSRQPIRARMPFHVADYGTADAGTSLGLLTQVVKEIRKREEEKQVVIHYEDQLTNEWKSVFNHALGKKTVKDAYGKDVDTPYNLGNVFVEACGVGFHSQCYPNESIDLGLSFTAMHWLSSSPSSLKGSDYMHAARCPDGPPVAEKTQAETDWVNILQARSNELSEGGVCVFVNFCVSEDGYFLGQTDTGASMWDSFQTSWNTLKEQGHINEEERLGVSFPNYYRTTQEYIAGIEQIDGLRLISAEEKVVPCPYREQYLKKKSGTDACDAMTPQEYAKSFVPTTRTWSHSTFKAALNNNKSEEEKERVMEQFWLNYEELVAQSPESHGMDYVHSYLVVEKVSKA